MYQSSIFGEERILVRRGDWDLKGILEDGDGVSFCPIEPLRERVNVTLGAPDFGGLSRADALFPPVLGRSYMDEQSADK